MGARAQLDGHVAALIQQTDYANVSTLTDEALRWLQENSLLDAWLTESLRQAVRAQANSDDSPSLYISSPND